MLCGALQLPAGDRGEFVWDEFPHAIEYLVYAYLQDDKAGDAAKQRDRLRNTARLQPSFKTAFHLSSTAARYALERGDWKAAAALPVRTPDTLSWDKYPWPEAVTWFARGIGAAKLGDPAGAQVAIEHLLKLEAAGRRTLRLAKRRREDRSRDALFRPSGNCIDAPARGSATLPVSNHSNDGGLSIGVRDDDFKIRSAQLNGQAGDICASRGD